MGDKFMSLFLTNQNMLIYKVHVVLSQWYNGNGSGTLQRGLIHTQSPQMDQMIMLVCNDVDFGLLYVIMHEILLHL